MDSKNFYWYTVTVQFVVEDEQTGKIKKVKELYLVKAASITDAETQVAKDLDGTMSDYRILTANESKIIRIIKPETADLNA
jgi:hypothetical protein